MDTWENFLTDVLPDPALRRFLRRLIGYGYLSFETTPVSAVFVGSGPNGKTTLAKALQTALGVEVSDDMPLFVPRRFTIVTANALPQVSGPALAVPFTEEFPPSRRDPQMLARLHVPHVRDAIRAWARDGFYEYADMGFSEPPGVERIGF